MAHSSQLSGAGSEATPTGDGIAIREAAYELNLPQREPMKMFTDNRAAVFIGEDAAAVRKSKADCLIRGTLSFYKKPWKKVSWN